MTGSDLRTAPYPSVGVRDIESPGVPFSWPPAHSGGVDVVPVRLEVKLDDIWALAEFVGENSEICSLTPRPCRRA